MFRKFPAHAFPPINFLNKSYFKFSQINPIPLKTFMEAPDQVESKNGFKASKQIFKIDESHVKQELTYPIKLLNYQAVLTGIAGIGASFMDVTWNIPAFLIVVSFSNVITSKRLTSINDTIVKENSNNIQSLSFSEDKKSLIFHTVMKGWEPLTCGLADVSYVKCTDQIEKFTSEDEKTKKEIEITKKLALIEFQIKTKEKDGKNHKKNLIAKCFYQSNDTQIPNMGLFKAILNGDINEIQKYDLSASDADLGNDMENYTSEVAEDNIEKK